jgi:hypothetical protein
VVIPDTVTAPALFAAAPILKITVKTDALTAVFNLATFAMSAIEVGVFMGGFTPKKCSQ